VTDAALTLSGSSPTNNDTTTTKFNTERKNPLLYIVYPPDC
jgi:hypothetical protein